MPSNETARARAHAGAEYLDRTEPGWWERVDVERLDLCSSCRCILGQLDGCYLVGRHRRGMSAFEAAAIGLSLHYMDDPEEPEELTAAWRDEIRQRQKGTA